MVTNTNTDAAVTVGVRWVNPLSTMMAITVQYLGPCVGVTAPVLPGQLDISGGLSTIIQGLELFSLYRVTVTAAVGTISVTNITTPPGGECTG
jgi:hypothetical protein